MSCGCKGQRCRIDADDPRHGTKNGYTNLLCRCQACSAANTAYYQGKGKKYQEAYRQRLADKGLRSDGKPFSPHPTAKCGTRSGYMRHRRSGEVACDDCKAAASAYSRKQLQKSRLRRDRALIRETLLYFNAVGVPTDSACDAIVAIVDAGAAA